LVVAKCVYPFPCLCKTCESWSLMKPTINAIREDQEKIKMNKETEMFKILDFDCPENNPYTKEALNPTSKAFVKKALAILEDHTIFSIATAGNSGCHQEEIVAMWDAQLSKILNGEIL